MLNHPDPQQRKPTLDSQNLIGQFSKAMMDLVEYAEHHDQDEFLTFALDIVGDFVDSPIGFYHFVDTDQKNLCLQQWSSRTLKEFCHAHGKGAHYPIDKAGVWVDCVRAGTAVVHNDYESLEHKKGLPEGHARVIRELVVPVKRNDKIVAILGVGNKETDYDQKDIDLVSYLADITWEILEKKQTRVMLQQKQELFSASFFNNPTPMCIIDTQNSCVVVFNREFLKLSQCSSEELMNLSTEQWEFHCQEDVDCSIEKMMRKGKSFQNRLVEWVNLSGVRKELKIHATFLKYSGDSLMILMCNDITRERKAEREFRRSETLYERLFYNMNSGVLLCEALENGADFKVLNLNPSAERITGMKLEDLKGQLVSSILSGIERSAILESFTRSYRKGEPFHQKEFLYHFRKSAKWMEFWTHPLPDGNMVVIFEEKTEEKQLQERLRQSEKMESLGHLAGGIAHDFNNMLAAIIGYTDLSLQECTDHPEVKDYLNYIIEASEKAESLVKEILFFSRRHQGRKVPLKASAIFRDATEQLRVKLPARIHVDFNIEEDSVALLSNPASIYRVFRNLCDNALQSMEEQGELMIRYDEIILGKSLDGVMGASLPGHYARLIIGDKGCGIPEEDLGHIFEPFYTTRSFGQSSGMGLSVVFGIVKSIEGNILVKSEMGKGSTFMVLFPKKEILRDHDLKLAELPKGKNELILLLTDNKPGREILEKLLREYHYRVQSFADAEEAWSYYQENKELCQLLLCDITRDVERWLQGENPLPFVYIQALEERTYTADMLMSGIRAIMETPLQKQKLLRTLQQILSP